MFVSQFVGFSGGIDVQFIQYIILKIHFNNDLGTHKCLFLYFISTDFSENIFI